jgi:hypothetical protein
MPARPSSCPVHTYTEVSVYIHGGWILPGLTAKSSFASVVANADYLLPRIVEFSIEKPTGEDLANVMLNTHCTHPVVGLRRP